MAIHFFYPSLKPPAAVDPSSAPLQERKGAHCAELSLQTNYTVFTSVHEDKMPCSRWWSLLRYSMGGAGKNWPLRGWLSVNVRTAPLRYSWRQSSGQPQRSTGGPSSPFGYPHQEQVPSSHRELPHLCFRNYSQAVDPSTELKNCSGHEDSWRS